MTTTRSGPRIGSMVEAIVSSHEYLPGDPVDLRVVTRRFPCIDDRGAAVAKAGRPEGWLGVATALARDLDVNVNRAGVLSLPVVPRGPGFDEIARRVAEASVALYGELLELDA